MKRRIRLNGAILGLCASCVTKHPAPQKSASAGNASAAPAVLQQAPAASSSATDGPSAPSLPALSDAGLTAFVTHWRSAQKNHDFAAYSACYAEHFSGLVLHGASAARVDRAAWLRAHTMSLALEPALTNAPIHIARGAGGARITFGSASRNAKRMPWPELFVVSSADGPQIARETPARAAPSELSERPGQWLADEHFAILSTAPDAAWAEGNPTFGGENTATSAVALSRLPKALRAWLGRPVRVLGESGTVCETRLQRFALRAKISPDLATAEVWDGCADGRGPTPAAIAQDIWRLSAGDGRTLIAEFSAPCKGALLAVDPDLEAPPTAAPEPAPAELGVAAFDAFRKLPDYALIQERFKLEQPGTEGAWDDHEARRGVSLLALPGHAPLLFMSVEAGSGCSNFSASLSALWEIHAGNPGASLILLAVPHAEDDRRLTPRALIELNGKTSGASLLLGPDGTYGARSWLSPAETTYRQTLLTSVPFFAGPC